MQHHKDDIIRLRHILEYAQKAIEFNRGRNRVDLDNDEMLAMATIHAIEIIGEAVRTISEEFRERYVEIPWDLIVGTRNRLAHGYIDVDLDIIWTILTRDLIALIKELNRILEEEGGLANP